MTENSYNGWPASPSIKTRPLVVAGVSFVPGILDDDDVHDVFEYLFTQYHLRVEPLVNPGCWGFAYRADRNDPSQLSCHASATAGDANAPQHPNDVPVARTLTPKQLEEIHAILAELDHVITWGGDFIHTIDGMHYELAVPPTAAGRAQLHATAVKVRALEKPAIPVSPVTVARDQLTHAHHQLGQAIATLKTADGRPVAQGKVDNLQVLRKTIATTLEGMPKR